MNDFPIDWQGRTGPHQIIVDLTPDQVAERLAISLVFEDSPRDFRDPNRRYAGEIVHTHFWMRALRARRRAAPILRADMEEMDGVTRIVFQIEADLWYVWPALIGLPIVSVGSLALALYLGQLCPAVLPLLLAVLLVIGFLNAKQESSRLLRYFLELFAEDRVSANDH